VIVPGYVFPLMMVVGAALALIAAWAQFSLLRGAGLVAAKPFSVATHDADQNAFTELRASPRWKQVRLMLWAGSFLLILGGLMQIPEVLR